MAIVRSGFGVEVIEEVQDEWTPPCQHGPALLFERYTGDPQSPVQRFYACSAFRGRKDCSFFILVKDLTDSKRKELRARYLAASSQSVQVDAQKRMEAFMKLSESERAFCQSCSQLLLKIKLRKEHEEKKHSVISPVTDLMFAKPSHMLLPLQSNKTFAQYLFSQKTIDFVVSTLLTLKLTNVLCVGCPRLHEHIQSLKLQVSGTSNQWSSLLLDLDARYHQFNRAEQFCQYNMFNHHFFGGKKAEDVFNKFLSSSQDDDRQSSNAHQKHVVIVIDPPFGGMVQPLKTTLDKINLAAGCDIPVIWFFPYFMERHIQEACPHLAMLDYEVTYDNHTLFNCHKQRSPVRIFTSLPASKVILPSEQGYWYCSVCDRYSAAENKHCVQCQACTSKDGKTYIHCDRCNRCVKPSRVHCDTCHQCLQADHKCGQTNGKGCHICGEHGHKRRDCPKREQLQTVGQKRNFRGKQPPKKKKRIKRKQ